jgi:hypothetical protein
MFDTEAVANSRTATPIPADRFISSRDWTIQPHAVSRPSIAERAMSSGWNAHVPR